jgi:DNA-directed RNA polymerase specialized sigma24 family protein
MPLPAFEETVLPHLDAAFNYARWLTRNDLEAEDVVQDACVRAMRFFSSFETTTRGPGYSRWSRILGTAGSRAARRRTWRRHARCGDGGTAD